MFSPFLLKRYRSLFTEDELSLLARPLPRAIRVNTLKIPEEELVARLSRRGFTLEKIPWTRHGYLIKTCPLPLGATPEYLLGYYFIQDPSSMYACEALNPDKKDLVLDMAAAPGGKTTYLSQLMENNGTIVAVDISRRRMKSLRSNVSRMGGENVLAIRTNALSVENFGLTFDKILLDAPCTGTGTVHRNREAALKERGDVERCMVTQEALLDAGVRVLKEGGVILYCTCSFLPEENEFVVEKVLNRHPLKLEEIKHGRPGLTSWGGRKLSSELKKARRFSPHIHGTQGFFIAKLRLEEG